MNSDDKTTLSINYYLLVTVKYRGVKIPVARPVWRVNFFVVALNICGSLVRILLHVTLLVPAVLRWLLESWKIFGSLIYVLKGYRSL